MPISALFSFALGILTLAVSGKVKRYRGMLIALGIVAFVAGGYLSFRSERPQEPSPSPRVEQETKGANSPAIQGVTGDVTITNQQTTATPKGNDKK